MSDDISRILQIVTRTDENVRVMNDRVFMLAEDQRALRDDQRALRNEVRNELTAMAERMITMRTEVMARMDRLQDDITSIKDDIGVHYRTADRALEMNEHTRAEVRSLSEVVTAMGRQIQRLQADVRTLKGEP